MMLSRPAIARVVQSLVSAELTATRGRRGQDFPKPLRQPWPENLRLGESQGTGETLGCDSLERLWLASAVNEMFHLHELADDTGLLAEVTFGAWVDRVTASLNGGVERITFSTSGSTGRPKRVSHTFVFLHAEIRALSSRWDRRRRVVALLPSHHIYGFLFTVWLPEALGIETLDAANFGPGELSRQLRPGDLVVTFPERWSWLQRSLPHWPADVEGVVSTAPCSAELIDALRADGLDSMTEVYGSTETAGIAMREEPNEAYRLMPQWSFAAPLDEAAPTLIHRSGLEVALMDTIQRAGPDSFRLAGRKDGMVQVGGVNVSPDRIAAQLSVRPGVTEAAVRLMRPEEGTRLKAFVIPDSGQDPEVLRRNLEDWAATQLPASERPKSFTMGDALPKNSLGKNIDW
ncbi:AMP-binding protein [Methylobacterium sp. BTF04]|uniref:AMP-binding protein n=1 Tax=Methylobacterium sp. BTF04 TaxID=2708300 RepID=UPI0013D075B0|nr:AMP-binding protein [Methylobacterium sp. BTF04]NEU14624.1 AMP-binding protein [Methylobacterium sp. BTF04]